MRIGDTIYLDHQATTPVDTRVFSAMAPYFVESFGNPHSLDHFLGWQASQAVETSAASVASLIHADPDEIIFTSGATEANNLALLGLGRRAAHGKRRRIIVSTIEHKSVLAVGRVLHEQLDYDIEYLPVDGNGYVNVAALKRLLLDDVLVVSIMAVNNEIGTIQDVAEISKIVRESGAIFHCDAVQAPCAVDLHGFSELVDCLSLSAHKMYGPKGIGALFIRRELQDRFEPLVYGGGQQHGLRSGTVPVALCVGMGAAARLISSDHEQEEHNSLRVRRDKLVQCLMNLSWPVFLNGPEGSHRHPGNANMRFSGFAAHDILNALQPRLAASTGSACTSGIPEPSHVLRAIGLPSDEAEASIRFSIGRGTSDQDIEDAVGLVNDALSRLAQADLAQSA